MTFYLISPFIQAQVNIDSLVKELETKEHTVNEQLSLSKKITSFYVDNEVDKAFDYSKRGLLLSQKESNNEMEAWFSVVIADCYDTWEKPDTALIYYQKAIASAIKTKDNEVISYAYIGIGVFYYLKDQNIMSLDYYMKALSLLNNTNNKDLQLITLSNIGSIYRSLLDNERAVIYLNQAKEIAEEINSVYGMMNVYYDLGLIFLDNKDTDKALMYIHKVVEYSRTLIDKQFEILGLQALAYIYCDGYKDYNKAEEYANESLIIAENFGSQRLINCALVALSDIYLESENYIKSEAAALKVWQYDSLNTDEGRSLTHNIAISNAMTGKKDKAYAFFLKNRELNKEYIKTNLHTIIADLEVKYETERKEMRIAALEEKQKLYIGLGITVGFVFLLIIILLSVRHRLNIQKRKLAEQQIKQLKQEKQLIATQSILDGETAERVRLSRDLHDGLGGMLSVAKLYIKKVSSNTIQKNTNINHLNKSIEMLDKSIDELRRVAHHIMPDSLIRYGLRISLEDFCGAVSNANFQYSGSEKRLDDKLELVLYRCAYELVNNAVKYAEARTINVQLMIDSGLASLVVQDNGKGFNPEKVSSGSGLDNIRTRISAYSGKTMILSSPGKGTEVCIELENHYTISNTSA